MRLLTRLLSICSPTRIGDLDGLDFADSGEHLRKGRAKNPLIKPSPDQFLRLVCLTRRDGALEHPEGASDGL
jgi:hypothetical protein